MLDASDLSCDGVAPIGPVCPWPQPSDWEARTVDPFKAKVSTKEHDTVVQVGVSKMAQGLFKSAGYAIKNGRVSSDVRNERLKTCMGCEHFIEASKRCSQCGCFMEAKTWIAGDKAFLCPKDKWQR